MGLSSDAQQGSWGRRSARWLVALCMVGAACGDSGVVVNNSNPLGTVGGLVVDGVSQLPLDGVAVKLLSGGGTFDTTTGTDGFYKLAQVPAGTFTIELSKEGFLPITIQGELAGSVGNFPISSPVTTVSPFGMVPKGPDFIVRVVDGNGVAVNGAVATARMQFSYIDLSSGTQRFLGSTVSSATTGADGRLVFKGLPDMQKFGAVDAAIFPNSIDTVQVAVAPIAVAGQENYQYAGGIFSFRLLALNLTVAQIVLPGPTDPLTVLESNLEWLRAGFVPTPAVPVLGSLVDTTGTITIAFSEAIDPATLRAQVTLENGMPGPMLTPTVNLNLVSLAGTFTAGTRYNLYLQANAALNPSGPARQKTAVVPFFGKPAMGTKPTVVSAKITPNGGIVPTFTVTFTLSEPIGLGDQGVQAFDCALFFEGANFDGSGAGAVNVVGEWATDPNALSCSAVSPVAGAAVTANTTPGHLNGVENVGNLSMPAPPVTGFVSTFTSVFGAYTVAAMAAPGAVVPVAGGKGHLYFTNNVKSAHRVNGEALGDIALTLQ
jgi:hypothetical protein